MKRLLVPVAGLVLIGSGFGAGIAVSAASADDPAPVTVNRQSLAEVTAPPGAPKRTLGLSKVVVMPGSKLASHHHPGAQLGYIAEGALTYTVESGSAAVHEGPRRRRRPSSRGSSRATPTRSGRPVAREEQGEVHHARNAGTVPIVIYLSTLFKTGQARGDPGLSLRHCGRMDGSRTRAPARHLTADPGRGLPRPDDRRRGEDVVRDVLADVPGMARAIGFRNVEAALSCVVGIGSDAWDGLRRARPAELHPFAELRGPRHTAPATPGDLSSTSRPSSSTSASSWRPG